MLVLHQPNKNPNEKGRVGDGEKGRGEWARGKG